MTEDVANYGKAQREGIPTVSGLSLVEKYPSSVPDCVD
jgi:hypothetical protein